MCLCRTRVCVWTRLLSWGCCTFHGFSGVYCFLLGRGSLLLLLFCHKSCSTLRLHERQASLSITSSRSLLKLTSIESVMPSNQSHPLSPRSPTALNLSQLQGLFQGVSSLHQVAKVLELQHQSFRWIIRTDFLWDWLVGSPCCPRDSQESALEPPLQGLYLPILLFALYKSQTSIRPRGSPLLLFKYFLIWTIFKVFIEFVKYCFSFMFCFFGPEGCGILAAPPGIKPTACCIGRWSLNHLTAREVLRITIIY